MNRQRYVRSPEEAAELFSIAQRERGYVDGSFKVYPAGRDSWGSDLFLCYWRWLSVPVCADRGCMADAVHGERYCTRHGERVRPGEGDLVRGCAS
jgi:hypothetical protein